MRFSNPTQIRLGQTGTFFNRTYRVIGRAVLGVLEGGQAYFWNEFYLESAGGGPATLVFEETETGCAWRLFTMFDSPTPMTAAEAASKKEGDVVVLDGASLRVTHVDRSQVYYVEGKAPEGVVTGRAANYFNADAGSREIVVSWTGEEVEYYSGMTTSAPLVASAFKLQGFAAWRFMASKGRTWFNVQIWMPAVLGLALILIPLACFLDLSRPHLGTVVTVTSAPKVALRVGASGILNGDACTITGHEVTEIAEVGRRWQRHEYALSRVGNDAARLIYETVSNAPVWFFYTPVQLDGPLTPWSAGGLGAGKSVKLAGQSVIIKELFRSTVRSSEGESVSKAGDMFYGFTGFATNHQVLCVRWNQTNIICLQGTTVPTESVLAAFGQTTGKQTPR